MKKFLPGLIIFMVLLIVGLVGGAYVLPDQVTVKRSLVMRAPQEKIFALVGDLRRVDEWSEWSKIDPTVQIAVTGAPGVGQKLVWASNSPAIGVGTQTVETYQAPLQLVSDIDMANLGKSSSFWVLVRQGDTTDVTYGMTIKLESVMERWLGLMINQAIGRDFKEALDRVEAIVTAPDKSGATASPQP